MNVRYWLLAAIVTSTLVGCTPEPSTSAGAPPSQSPDPMERLRENRAKLSAEDQKLVAEQEYCPVMPGVQLGAMGVPIKLKIKDQTVFVCCKSCSRRAEDDPDATLKSLAEVKEKAKSKKK